MYESILENYLADAIAIFRNYKLLAEGALEQVSDEEFFRALDGESNSIALVVKHIAGNQLSRWTSFLTTDGEKPDRKRDTEFDLIADTRDLLMKNWERGWRCLFSAIDDLEPADMHQTVTIRGEPHRVIEAINRQLTHYAYHIGQIVFLAKHFRGVGWKSLSVPKNRSAEYNEFLSGQKVPGGAKTNPIKAATDFAKRAK